MSYYYILANQFDGELIQVSTEPLEAATGQILKIRDGVIPDLTKYEWHGGSLAFIESPKASRYITQTQFLKRLTDDEIRNIYQLAESNLDARIWLDKFKMAQYIWLDHEELKNGLFMFEAMSLIQIGRAAEILGWDEN